jgi:hypothetical protein
VDLNNHIPIDVTNFSQGTSWIAHPTVDLAIIPLGEFLTQLGQQGHTPYYISLEHAVPPSSGLGLPVTAR